MTRALHTIEADRRRCRTGTALATKFEAHTPSVSMTVGYRDVSGNWVGDASLDAELAVVVSAMLPDLLARVKSSLAETYRIASEELVVAAAKAAMESI